MDAAKKTSGAERRSLLLAITAAILDRATVLRHDFRRKGLRSSVWILAGSLAARRNNVGIAYDLLRNVIGTLSRFAPEPLSYYQDGLYTIHSAEFLADAKFQQAYARACSAAGRAGRNLHIEWRIYVCCWAATQALRHAGDFIECGVNTGMNSHAVAKYVSFEKLARRFYLMDTFEGLPAEQFLPEEIAMGLKERYTYQDVYASTLASFNEYANVTLIKGKIPATLADVPATKVAYVSIDMNAVVPEIAAAEYFWELLVPGGIVVLDDYNWRRHVAQRRAFDAFARERGIAVLAMPTGQGLMIKP